MKDRHSLKIVRGTGDANDRCVRVTLFRVDLRGGLGQRICGWIAGAIGDGQPDEVFLPASAKIRASVAIVRALEVSRTIGAEVCVVDPDGLWADAWRGR